jgi:thymidylate synthase
MSIRDNEADMGNDSPACLQSIQYFIRSGQLHCKVLFRSNDAAKATFMNAFALIMLQKRFADELGVNMGSYTHRANSFHCYEKDWEMLSAYINRIAAGDVTYDYAGDWDEQMEDAKAEIAETVRVLKEER